MKNFTFALLFLGLFVALSNIASAQEITYKQVTETVTLPQGHAKSNQVKSWISDNMSPLVDAEAGFTGGDIADLVIDNWRFCITKKDLEELIFSMTVRYRMEYTRKKD